MGNTGRYIKSLGLSLQKCNGGPDSGKTRFTVKSSGKTVSTVDEGNHGDKGYSGWQVFLR